MGPFNHSLSVREMPEPTAVIVALMRKERSEDAK